jgi:hypothetical protein
MMADTTDKTATVRTPWHLWLVAVLGVLWNGFGVYDYTMSKLQGDAYLKASGMTEPQIVYFHAMPAWVTVCWALGVWGAIVGTVLLFARSRWAASVFWASLAGLVGSLVHTHLLSNGREIMGQQVLILNGVILVGCLFFIWYSARMAKAGVLR